MGEAKRRKKAAKPSLDSGLKVLSPQRAVEHLKHGDRSKMFLPIQEFCEWIGLGPEQFRQEAAAGRLKVFGVPRGPDAYSDLCITVENAIEWMAWRRIQN